MLEKLIYAIQELNEAQHYRPDTTAMKGGIPRLVGVLFLLALLALGYLLMSDFWLRFEPSVRHQRSESLALIFAGGSFICLQFRSRKPWKEIFKGVLLGGAFILWGVEQCLPAGRLATIIDSAVITIFVLDLGLMIASNLGDQSKMPSGGRMN